MSDRAHQPHALVKGRHGQGSQARLQTEIQRALGVGMELSPAGKAGVRHPATFCWTILVNFWKKFLVID